MNKTIRCRENGIDGINIHKGSEGVNLVKINSSPTVVLDRASTIELVESLLENVGIGTPEFKSYGVFAIPYCKVEKQFGMIVRADGKLGSPGGS